MVSRRNALILMTLMAATSVGAVLARPEKRAASALPAIDLERMVPGRFGDWQVVPQAAAPVVNPQTKELLDKLYSQILTRTYADSEGRRVMLSLAYGSDQRGEMQAHKPEVCYPAQGFKLHTNNPGILPTPFGELPIRRLTTSMGARHEPVTYWFTVGDKAVGGTFYKRLVEIRYGLTGQIPDGLLFRVSSIEPDASRAFLRHEQFVGALLSSIDPADRHRLSGL